MKPFSRGATVISLTEDGRKVGQIAMVNQLVMIDGKEEDASQLVDLFIDKSHRGKRALTMLYGEVEKQFSAQKIRFGFGMPNAKAVRVNEHFFQLKPYLALDVRMGVSMPLTARQAASFKFAAELKNEVIALGDRFATPANENGLKWNGAMLFNRLSAAKFEYALHATDNLLLVSSPRETRGVKYTLLCGFLRNPAAKVTKRDIRSVTRSACGFWGRLDDSYLCWPLAALPAMPGFHLPKRIHHSPMLLQVRDFFPERGKFSMDRFQLMDFDFA